MCAYLFINLLRAAGIVYKAIENSTGNVVAIKEMALTQDSEQLILNEMYIMKRANHSCIVEFMGAYVEQRNNLWVRILSYC